jgi:hypothetical protein
MAVTIPSLRDSEGGFVFIDRSSVLAAEFQDAQAGPQVEEVGRKSFRHPNLNHIVGEF